MKVLTELKPYLSIMNKEEVTAKQSTSFDNGNSYTTLECNHWEEIILGEDLRLFLLEWIMTPYIKLSLIEKCLLRWNA